MALKDFLMALAPGLKEERSREWDALVQKNPDLARTSEEYESGRDEYVRNRRVPKSRPSEVRFDTGVKTERPIEGGGTFVNFPTTEVGQAQSPIRMGRQTGFVRESDPSQVLFPSGGERADSLHIINDRPGRIPTTSGGRNVEMRDLGSGVKGLFVDGNFVRAITPVQLGRQLGHGAAGKSPQEIADLNTMRIVEQMMGKTDFVGNPIPVPDELLDEYMAANQRIGRHPAGAAGDMSAAGSTQPLTKEQAQEFLRKANGDKAKARQMAKAAGFSF